MAQQPLSRRHILILAGTGIAALALPVSFRLSQHDEKALPQTLLSLLTDPESAADLGERWMEKSKSEISLADLATRIEKRLHAQGWHPADGVTGMHEALATRVRRDFVQNDMIDIAGWQVSRTSAELCALAALNRRAV